MKRKLSTVEKSIGKSLRSVKPPHKQDGFLEKVVRLYFDTIQKSLLEGCVFSDLAAAISESGATISAANLKRLYQKILAEKENDFSSADESQAKTNKNSLPAQNFDTQESSSSQAADEFFNPDSSAETDQNSETETEPQSSELNQTQELNSSTESNQNSEIETEPKQESQSPELNQTQEPDPPPDSAKDNDFEKRLKQQQAEADSTDSDNSPDLSRFYNNY